MDDDVEAQKIEHAERMALLAEAMTTFIELAAGHKMRAMEAGFAEDTAEQMASQVHAGLVAGLFSGGQG